jgi:hypothetical protein
MRNYLYKNLYLLLNLNIWTNESTPGIPLSSLQSSFHALFDIVVVLCIIIKDFVSTVRINFYFKKPDVYSRRNCQDISAKLNKSDVYSRGGGSTENLKKKKKTDVYSRRDSQEKSAKLNKSDVYSRGDGSTENLF